MKFIFLAYILWNLSVGLTFSRLCLIMAVADVKKVIDKNSPRHISAAVENLLKTGRLVTQSGLDLQQV